MSEQYQPEGAVALRFLDLASQGTGQFAADSLIAGQYQHITLLHCIVQVQISTRQRAEISGDQALAALEQLDELGDQLVTEYRLLLRGKN